jgi:hypothetical protein
MRPSRLTRHPLHNNSPACTFIPFAESKNVQSPIKKLGLIPEMPMPRRCGYLLLFPLALARTRPARAEPPPEAPLTQEAKASLERLAKQTAAQP